MPSFRAALGIGALLPGTDPAAVLPAGAQAARELTTVESYDLAIVHGQPRITVRFTAEDDDEAVQVARRVVRGVSSLAEVRQLELTRRWGPRWHPVYSPPLH